MCSYPLGSNEVGGIIAGSQCGNKRLCFYMLCLQTSLLGLSRNYPREAATLSCRHQGGETLALLLVLLVMGVEQKSALGDGGAGNPRTYYST